MLRSIVLSMAVAAVCLAADQADARGWRRGGCSGGSCGVSSGCYGGSCGVTTTSGSCYGGQCQIAAPAAPVVKSDAPASAPATAEVKESVPAAQPVVQTYNTYNNRRFVRWRVGGRRFR